LGSPDGFDNRSSWSKGLSVFDLLSDLKALKDLFVAKDFWAAGDKAWSLAKKVKALLEDLSDSGLFNDGNPAEFDAAVAELEAAVKPVFGAEPVADNDPKAIDPVTVITLVTLVLDLIKKWREKRNK
jgi:hypothetical protein